MAKGNHEIVSSLQWGFKFIFLNEMSFFKLLDLNILLWGLIHDGFETSLVPNS